MKDELPNVPFLDVLIGQRVYEQVRWDPETHEVIIVRGRTEPLRIPFAYIKRWRPRANGNEKGTARWKDGPFKAPKRQ